jgi:hypothetical protein
MDKTAQNDMRVALEALIQDADATYKAAGYGKPFVISIGQFRRLELAKKTIAASTTQSEQAAAPVCHDCDVRPDGTHEETCPEAAAAPVAVDEPAWNVGNLLTMSDSEYPGMGAMFAQVWQGDALIARVYGDSAEEVRNRAARIALAAAPAQQPFAWATFDGEGGYDLRLYEGNENYRHEYIQRNGEKYADWVLALGVIPPAAPAQQPTDGMTEPLSKKLWCDLKTDRERSQWLLMGRGYETGVVSRGVATDLAMAYHRLDLFSTQAAGKDAEAKGGA